MKRRTLVAILTSTMTLASCSFGGELIENGDFRDDLNYWKLERRSGYVPAPATRCRKGELSFSGLSFLTKTYLSLRQAVEIKKGVRYKLSYEIKGPATQTYAVRLGSYGDPKNDIKPTLHYRSAANLKVAKGWQTVVAEFTGKFDTDRNWYRKVSKARQNNRLDKKGSARTPRGADKVKVDASDRPCTTTLNFLLGSLEGRLSIRNISIQEVETPRGSR